jgi:hypothetical protein
MIKAIFIYAHISGCISQYPSSCPQYKYTVQKQVQLPQKTHPLSRSQWHCPFIIREPVANHGNTWWRKLMSCAWESLGGHYGLWSLNFRLCPLQLPINMTTNSGSLAWKQHSYDGRVIHTEINHIKPRGNYEYTYMRDHCVGCRI